MRAVLIVEDEKMIRKGIKSMVERSGVPVDIIIECNNGEKALEVLKNQHVDLVFTDIRMPKVDGIELVRKMQKLPNKPEVVAISGYDDFSYAVELMRMGVKEYLLKPVDREEIKRILENTERNISKDKEKAAEIRSIFYEQLKLIILGQSDLIQEIKSFANQNSHKFYNNDYVICCLTRSDMDDYETNQYIYLSDVDNNDLIILGYDNKEYLINSELKQTNIGVSSKHKGLKELEISYKEALNARKLAFVKDQKIVVYNENNIGKYSVNNDSSDNKVDPNLMKALAQQLGTDTYETAIRQVEKMKYNTTIGEFTLDVLMDNLCILLNEILEIYQNVLELDEKVFEALSKPLTYPSINDYFEELIDYIRDISYRIDTQFDDYKNKSKIHAAISYINENYYKDLNMAVVSNYISMNYSLFSQTFKQYTGSNFVDYLKNLRLNEAKRLLEETDLKINEISKKIGYNNAKHFMKTFKDTLGVSPSQYRKNAQLKGDT